MISSIDAERHLAKFNTHFIRKNKTLGKLEMRGNFLKLIKSSHKNSITNSI